MTLFLLTLAIFGLVMFGMSLGVILGNRRIRGSCGGLSDLGTKHEKVTCDGCSSDGGHCSQESSLVTPFPAAPKHTKEGRTN